MFGEIIQKKDIKIFIIQKNILVQKLNLKLNVNCKILITMYGFNEQPFRPLDGYYDNYNINKDLYSNNKIFFKNLSSNLKTK